MGLFVCFSENFLESAYVNAYAHAHLYPSWFAAPFQLFKKKFVKQTILTKKYCKKKRLYYWPESNTASPPRHGNPLQTDRANFWRSREEEESRLITLYCSSFSQHKPYVDFFAVNFFSILPWHPGHSSDFNPTQVRFSVPLPKAQIEKGLLSFTSQGIERCQGFDLSALV